METAITIVSTAGVLVFVVTAIATVVSVAVASLAGLVGVIESLLDAIDVRARHVPLPPRRAAA